MTTAEYLARLDRLPVPSAKLIAFRDALRAFLKEDQPGGWKAPAGRINAKDQMEAIFDALPYNEKEIVRACERGEGGG
jgi:hypothetical protein